MSYRKIWQNHFGKIPRDSDGKSFEIHHINGDHNDNRIENLLCISIQEHFNIHLDQGDYGACAMIAKRMNMTSQEISALQKGTKLSSKTKQNISKSRKKFLENGGTSWNSGVKGYSLKINRKGTRYSSKIPVADIIFMRSFLKEENRISFIKKRKDETYYSQLTNWLQKEHFPHLSKPAIRNLLEGKSREDVRLFENSKYEILTPNGFEKFDGILIQEKQGINRIVLENNQELRCTISHLVKTKEFGFKKSQDLTEDDFVETNDGFIKVKEVIRERISEVVYDPINVGKKHEYISNGITSHNCEFLSSDSLLVDPIKLNQIRTSEPCFVQDDFNFFVCKEELSKIPVFLVGIDPATGSGNDLSVIEVYSFPDLKQIIEFKSNRLQIPFLYMKITWILKYLTSIIGPGNQRPEVYWSFERNAIGEAISALYFNDENQNEFAELINDDKSKFGMYTTGRSKVQAALALKTLVEKVSNGITVNSDHLVFELKNYITRGKGYEAKTGATDDAVSATLIMIRILEYIAKFNEKARNKVYDYEFADAEEQKEKDEPMPFSIL